MQGLGVVLSSLKTLSTVTDGKWGDMVRIGLWPLGSERKSLTFRGLV